MDITLMLQMAADGMGERVAVGDRAAGLTMEQLATRARRAGAFFATRAGERVGLVDLNSEAVPLSLFGSAFAGKPFVPINYRLSDERLRSIVARTAPSVIVTGDGMAERIGSVDGVEFVPRGALLDAAADPDRPLTESSPGDPEGIAVLLFTSGTTGEPKAAVLRHRNLTTYIISTVEFAGAAEDEAALVSVPAYHIAGISAVLSSTYGGRRIVYAEAFEPRTWVDLVDRQRITHAMVVPTMLARILDVVEEHVVEEQGVEEQGVEEQGVEERRPLRSLRNLSYGGGPMPASVVERAMALMPDVGFVNAYGLTETSSTIALLGPEDHREAFTSGDPAVRQRLASVGRPLPTLSVSIRDPDGVELPAGEVGEIWVSGEQVSGEYLGRPSPSSEGEWFRTRDAGHLDDAGFLYLHGRLDDVIVRGGENLSPGEIEAALRQHPAVADAAVVGLPDEEWGERVVAAVTLSGDSPVTEKELRDFVRTELRSTKTPERIQVRSELPHNEMGKLLRRVLRDELAAEFADS